MKNFDLENFCGLSPEEAAELLQKEGHNELPGSKKRSVFDVAFEVVKEPMFILLVCCGLLYLLLGSPREAALLLGFVLVVMGITFFQERKTENALDALKDLSSPRALVIRGGIPKRIAGRDVVRGDIMVVSEGDRVPADSVVIRAISLSADESLLTGESVPVRKSCLEDTEEIPDRVGLPGGDDSPWLYSGSMIVQGQAIAQVIAVAQDTEIGKIGRALKSVEVEDSLLSRETGTLVKNIAFIGAVLCLLVVLLFGILRGDWINGFLAGLSLAMAILPEEFPVVLTIFLALGAWRISKKHVLTRRVPVVETLGAATILCVDKTGTLTMNQMEVSEIYSSGEYFRMENKENIPDNFHELIEFGILASRKDSFDPMERALRSLGELKLNGTEHLHNDWELLEEYALSKELLAMSNVWKSESINSLRISAKGAPEAVIDLCHMEAKAAAELEDAVGKMSSQGFRVLGVASAFFKPEELPEHQHDFDFKFIGLIGFADPVRPGVKEAVDLCHKAGIRVVMITGDHPGTAQNIARQIGLSNCDDFLTGPELSSLSESSLSQRVRETDIFCRVVPEQKLRLVAALKANNEIVAMTGDGVNDAPALKAAHIGIAMGGRGTDVAREASSLVLLNDDFSSIVEALRMGRRIFDNLKKAMCYIFSVHVPIAGLSLLPLFISKNLILFPIHIVFLELIIDPACSVVFEAEQEESNLLSRPPRDISEPMFGKKNILIGLMQGLAVFLACTVVYFIGLSIGRSEEEARTLCYTTLILGNLGLIVTNRSWTESFLGILREKNRSFYMVTLGAILFLLIALYVPGVRKIFKFSVLHLNDIMLCLFASLLSISWFEIFKMIRNRSSKPS